MPLAGRYVGDLHGVPCAASTNAGSKKRPGSKNPPDALYVQYSGGMRIYLILSLSTGDSFVGITTLSVKEQWREHLREAGAGAGGRLGEAIRERTRDDFEHWALSDEIESVEEAGAELASWVTELLPALNDRHEGWGPLNEDDALAVYELLEGGETIPKVAELFEVPPALIQCMSRRRRFDHFEHHERRLRRLRVAGVEGSQLSTKITRHLAGEIRARVRAGERQIDLAREFDLSRSSVSNIVAGRQWRRR